MVSKFNNFRPQLVFAEQSAGSAVVLTTEQKLSLYKKSQKSGISTDVLEEVYRRGYSIWNESFGQTAEQFAFDRVNSFIAGGFAADLDEDLMNEERKGLWANIHAKRKRIKAGSGEKMRKPGSEGAPTDAALKASQTNEDKDPCWKGYKQIGMKSKGGKEVPNCVPVKESQEEDLKKVTDIAAKLKDMSKEPLKPTVKKLPHVNDPGTPEMFKIKESKETAENQSKNSDKPSSRFDGAKPLVNVYKRETPGQMKESALPTIKRIVAEATHQGRKVTLNKPFRTPGGPKKSAVYVDPDGDGKAKIVRFGDPKLSIKKNQPGRKRSYCARSSGQGNLTKKDSANYWSRRAWDC